MGNDDRVVKGDGREGGGTQGVVAYKKGTTGKMLPLSGAKWTIGWRGPLGGQIDTTLGHYWNPTATGMLCAVFNNSFICQVFIILGHY